MAQTYSGSCFCGAVKLTVTGDAEAAGFCHCASCRSWSAAPVNAFTLWKPAAVEVTKGVQHIGAYQKTEHSVRKFCTQCGGHLFTEHPTWGVVDVYAATIPAYPYVPKLHVNYAETVLPMRDGLPKFKDMPAEMSGSGAMVKEYA